MKLICSKSNLLRGVNIVSKAVPTEEYEKNETTRNMIETIKKKINPN